MQDPKDTTKPGGSTIDRPENPSRRKLLEGMALAGATLVVSGCVGEPRRLLNRTVSPSSAALDAALRKRVRHVIVIYCENRSFNNLFADFPGLEQPLSSVPHEHLLQRDRDGSVLATLPPVWKGLVPNRQEIDGKVYQIGQDAITGLANGPWVMCTTDGEPLPLGVVTRDLIHRFYRNQHQINGGKNDGFVAWGDSGALVMGRYGNSADSLHLWKLAQEYTLLDNFFMGTFGGSFLNHQYLIAAQPPVYPGADQSPAKRFIAVLDGEDPAGINLKLATGSPASAMDGGPKFVSEFGSLTPDFYAVNTMGPPYAPSFNHDPKNPELADLSAGYILTAQSHLTIGDTLTAKDVDWAWYAGAWQLALDGKGHDSISKTVPISPNFLAHHQPLNYFKQFGPGTKARVEHLRDAGVGNDVATNKFLADIAAGTLPQVTFYKPQGSLDMHSGYSDVAAGDAHVMRIIEVLRSSQLWSQSVVIVTTDENGGWWDHVAPPKGDRWGPGNRVPALVISPHAKKGHVDHTVYDTGSIQRFLNRRFGLDPLPGIQIRDAEMQRRGGVAPGDLTLALDLA